MRKFIFIICMLSFACSHGQELTVKSFKVKNNDLAASTNERKDNNGNSCALIKVQLAAAGAKFEPNVIGSVEYKINEYWVFLPTICKHLKIKHPNYLTKDIVFSEYGINSLESKTTYELVISIPDGTPAPQLVTSQYLIFKVNPSDAVVEVNDEIWTNNEGVARKFVPFGEYKYSIQSKDYHMASGTVSVQDPENKVTINIDLKPAFGTISIPSQKNLDGATVYIDNKLAGQVPLTAERIPSGEHSIRIAKSLYKSFESTAIVKDGETTTINPELQANFSVVTLNVDNNAEIWVNDEKKGEGSWTGNLESGDYKIETKKQGYSSQSKTYTISTTSNTQSIKLPFPTPIYGSLNILAAPDGCDIIIDGEKKGETPMFLQRILIGKHEVKIKKDGYISNSSSIIVTEGKTSDINIKLKKSIQTIVIPFYGLTAKSRQEAFRDSLEKYSECTELSICGGPILPEGLHAIRHICKKLKVLDLSGVEITTSGHRRDADNGLFSGYPDNLENGLKQIEKIILPLGYKPGEGAFADLKNLTEVVIPHGCKYIAADAFSGCSKLRKITLPSSFSGMNLDAFNNCDSLSDIYIYSKKPYTTYLRNYNDAHYKKAFEKITLHVPREAENAYRESEYGKFFNIQVMEETNDLKIPYSNIEWTTLSEDYCGPYDIFNSSDGHHVRILRKKIPVSKIRVDTSVRDSANRYSKSNSNKELFIYLRNYNSEKPDSKCCTGITYNQSDGKFYRIFVSPQFERFKEEIGERFKEEKGKIKQISENIYELDLNYDPFNKDEYSDVVFYIHGYDDNFNFECIKGIKYLDITDR